MVKFTITVSNGYIRERANIENIIKMCENGQSFQKGMVDIMAFTLIENELKTKDNVEYEINSNDFTDTKKLKIFNDALSLVASLAQIKLAQIKYVNDIKEVKEVPK